VPLCMLYFLAGQSYGSKRLVMKHMCGGNTDFVVGFNPQIGALVSTKTQKFTDAQLRMQSGFAAASEEMTYIDDTRKTNKSWYTNSFSGLFFSSSMSMQELAGSMTHCGDLTLQTLPYLQNHLQVLTMSFDAQNCSDMQHACGNPDNRFLRNLCPGTCGCNQPDSGLLLNGPAEGCPREACQRSQTYEDALAQIPCHDPSPAKLRQMKAWIRFSEEYFAKNMGEFPAWGHIVRSDKSDLLRYGCANVTMIGPNNEDLCIPLVDRTSVRPFCPVKCGCSAQNMVDCPSACYVSVNATH